MFNNLPSSAHYQAPRVDFSQSPPGQAVTENDRRGSVMSWDERRASRPAARPKPESQPVKRSSILQTPLDMMAPQLPSADQHPASRYERPTNVDGPRPSWNQPPDAIAAAPRPSSLALDQSASSEKARVASMYMPSPPLDGVHPALHPVVGERAPVMSQQTHLMSSSSAHPYQAHQPSISAAMSPDGPATSTKHDEDVKEAPPTSPRTPFAPAYDPYSPTGPNGMAPEAHRPGQISHPNMKVDQRTWEHDMCECGDISSCCLGCCCPCIIYGRTQYRLNQKSAKRDPTDLLGYHTCNTACMLMGFACGLQGFLALFQHGRIRSKYDIEGSASDDCVHAFCCLPCTLIQDEREVRDREGAMRKYAGPASGAGGAMAYTSTPPMAYAPPPRDGR